MPKPIFRIKRNQTTNPIVPSSLNQSELAVDFASNKLYTGTGTSVVQVGAKLSDDSSFPAVTDDCIPTQVATKNYIAANYNSSGSSSQPVPPKSVCDIRVLTWRPLTGGQGGTSVDGTRFIFSAFFDPNVIVTQTPVFILYGENSILGQQNTTGLYQTSANNMYLHVSYSVVYSPLNPGATNWPGTETAIEFWRGFGMRVLDTSTTPYPSEIQNPTLTNYGVQFTPPVIGTSTTTSYPTLISGSAIVKLPKWQNSDGNRWELQFYSQAKSSDGSLTLADYVTPSGASNIPSVAENYRLRIQIVRLKED